MTSDISQPRYPVSSLTAVALRLSPGDDLFDTLDAWAREQRIEAACVLTCVGSLSRAVVRFADQDEWTPLDGPWEIVALTGTLSQHGSHYHIALSDGSGRTIGGHVSSGCMVYTTAEIVLGVLPQPRFGRAFDPASGYDELDVQPLEDRRL